MRRWFITGTGRGLGREIAEAALATGDRVVGTTRSGRADWAAPGMDVLPLDVADPAACASAVREAVERLGGLDVVVNNAGRVRVGAVEEMTDPDLRAEFDVNFFGAAAVVRAALPAMRQAGRGHIVAISSVAAMVPGAATGSYAAAKAALEAFHVALSLEVAPLGIGVTIVSPGALRTSFLAAEGALALPTEIPVYGGLSGTLTERLRAIDGRQTGDPKRAAVAILKALDAAKPPLLLALGDDSVRMIRQRLSQVEADLAEWHAVSGNIAFPREEDASPSG